MGAISNLMDHSPDATDASCTTAQSMRAAFVRHPSASTIGEEPSQRTLTESSLASRKALKDQKKRRRHPVAKVKGNWQVEDDRELVKLVDEYGEGNWSAIARHFPGRIGKQCRERWHNQLRPDIKRDAWTEDEERRLIEVHRMIGNRWADIAKQIPGRTENAVKNHWNATLRRKDSPVEKSAGVSPILRQYMQSLNISVGKRKRASERRHQDEDAYHSSDSEEYDRQYRSNSVCRPIRMEHKQTMTMRPYAPGRRRIASSPYDDVGLLGLSIRNPSAEPVLGGLPATRPYLSPGCSQGGEDDFQLETAETDLLDIDMLSCRETLDHPRFEIDENEILAHSSYLLEDNLFDSQSPFNLFEDSCDTLLTDMPALASEPFSLADDTVQQVAHSTLGMPPLPMTSLYTNQNTSSKPWAIRDTSSELDHFADMGSSAHVSPDLDCTNLRLQDAGSAVPMPLFRAETHITVNAGFIPSCSAKRSMIPLCGPAADHRTAYDKGMQGFGVSQGTSYLISPSRRAAQQFSRHIP